MDGERHGIGAGARAAEQKACAQRFEYEQREERSSEIEGDRDRENRGPAIRGGGEAGEGHERRRGPLCRVEHAGVRRRVFRAKRVAAGRGEKTVDFAEDPEEQRRQEDEQPGVVS